MAADGWRHFITEAEGAADLQRSSEVARPEGNDRWLAMEFHWDMEDSGAPLAIAVKQGELTWLFPAQTDRGFPTQGTQPGDDSGPTVVRDDCEFVCLSGNHRPVSGVVADDDLGDQQGISAPEGDAAGLVIISIEPGDRGVAGQKGRVSEGFDCEVRQDELLGWHRCGTAGQHASVGGDEVAVVLRGEEDTVENLAGRVGGRAAGDDCERLERLGR